MVRLRPRLLQSWWRILRGRETLVRLGSRVGGPLPRGLEREGGGQAAGDAAGAGLDLDWTALAIGTVGRVWEG